MKTSTLPVSDLELFASRYLGIKDNEFDMFYEQYYTLNVNDELDDELEDLDYYNWILGTGPLRVQCLHQLLFRTLKNLKNLIQPFFLLTLRV